MVGGSKSFDVKSDIPDLSGKVILVTGGNGGLGYEAILQLSKHNPSIIYCVARNAASSADAIATIKKEVPNSNVKFIECDLTSFASVKKAAEEFSSANKRLDILMNNAGIMACPPDLTKEGYEIQFGTNHMGHALLTKLLLPTLLETAKDPSADVRIVNISSAANQWAPKTGLVLGEASTKMASYNTFQRYGQSKFANILYSQELAKLYPSIKTISVHPGSVQSGLMRGAFASFPLLTWPLKLMSPFMQVTVQTGALNQLWAATSQDIKTGTFYYPVAKINKGMLYEQQEKLATELWDYTEKEFAKHGY